MDREFGKSGHTIDMTHGNRNGVIKLAEPLLGHRASERVLEVLASGWVMQGPEVERFEKMLAEYIGCKYCVAVSSGTAAIHLGMISLQVKKGDAVFVPGFAWPSAANIASILGAIPVFVDVKHDSYNIDCDDLTYKIAVARDEGLNPALIVPVHQFGAPCDIHQVMEIASENQMQVLEDSACALGSFVDGKHVGLFGRMGILSFHPRKIITTGEGGALFTDDEEIAEQCHALRNHGDLKTWGLNYRMSDILAAVGVAQMTRLKSIVSKRRRVVALYCKLLKPSTDFVLPEYLSTNEDHFDVETNVQTLMVLPQILDESGHIKDYLDANKIEVRKASVSGHSLPQFNDLPAEFTHCPVSSELEEFGLALPLHAGLVDEDIARVVDILNEVVSEFAVVE